MEIGNVWTWILTCLLALLVMCWIVVCCTALFVPSMAIGCGTLVFAFSEVSLAVSKGSGWRSYARAAVVVTPPFVVCWYLGTSWASSATTYGPENSRSHTTAVIVSHIVFVGMSVWYYLPRWMPRVVGPWPRHADLDKFLPFTSTCILLFWALRPYLPLGPPS